MTQTPIKPCPFCGGVSIDPGGWATGDGRVGPACDDCAGTADSVTEWNTRPKEEKLERDLQECVELLERWHRWFSCNGEIFAPKTDTRDLLARIKGETK